jgi:hypothetical protein
VIRNATIHFSGRLPLVADLRALPAPADLSVLATNVRTRDGKRPSFADATDSWFVIPLREVLVIELPQAAMVELTHESVDQASERPPAVEMEPAAEPDTSPLETDETLLARIRAL